MPLAIILQPQALHALLAFAAQGIAVVLSHGGCDFGAPASVAGVGDGGWAYGGSCGAVGFHLLGELGEAVPFRLAVGFDRVGVVLLLRVFVRAFVEELRVYFHEEFHCVVDHAVDCSGVVLVLELTVEVWREWHTDSNDPSSSRKAART